MLSIALINMPFATVHVPSIALTQLKSVLESKFEKEVSVEIHYLNHDFAIELGVEIYNRLPESLEAQTSGLGEWLFRQAAFPGSSDDPEAYFKRYYPYRNEQTNMLKHSILKVRSRIGGTLGRLVEKYNLDRADIVGFTSMFAQNMACFALARELKSRKPKVITAMGGANCEPPMGQEILKNVAQIDYVFSGPALISFPQFVEYRLNGETEKCDDIRGVYSKKNYQLKPLQASLGEELDINVPVALDYEPFLNQIGRAFPNGKVKPALLFETSRGCWWGERAHCTFCGLNGLTMNYRAMSAERALEQFHHLFEYSPKCARFESVDNILPKSYLEEVLPFVQTPPGASLFYEVKADLSEKDMQVLAQAQVASIQPGIEALATSTLKLMKKGTTSFQNISLLKHCAQYNIKPLWNLLVGFPGEQEETYQKYIEDIPLLTHLPPPTGSYPVRFDRYSPYFTQAKQYGLDLYPLDYYQFVYPFPEESLVNIAYYFQDLNVGAAYVGAMTKWIKPIQEKVQLWRTRWQGSDGALPARLYFKKGEPTTVYDSRSGRVVEHQIGDTGRQVLENLSGRPKDLVVLASSLSRIPELDAAREVALLQEKGLVFQEGVRFLNLVLPDEPPMPNEEI